MRPLRIRFQQLNPNEPHHRIPGAASWRLVGDSADRRASPAALINPIPSLRKSALIARQNELARLHLLIVGARRTELRGQKTRREPFKFRSLVCKFVYDQT